MIRPSSCKNNDETFFFLLDCMVDERSDCEEFSTRTPYRPRSPNHVLAFRFIHSSMHSATSFVIFTQV